MAIFRQFPVRHLTEEEIELYSLGQLETSRIAEHLLACPGCCHALEYENEYQSLIRAVLLDQEHGEGGPFYTGTDRLASDPPVESGERALRREPSCSGNSGFVVGS